MPNLCLSKSCSICHKTVCDSTTWKQRTQALHLYSCHKLHNIFFWWFRQRMLHQLVATLLSRKCCWQPDARWSARFCSCKCCWQSGLLHLMYSLPISFTTTSGGLSTLSMLCSCWLLQPGHTPLQRLHVCYKAIHADHFSTQSQLNWMIQNVCTAWILKVSQEMLDATCCVKLGYSGYQRVCRLSMEGWRRCAIYTIL